MTQPPLLASRVRPAAAALPLVLLLTCGTGCVELPQAARLPPVRPSADAPGTGQAHPAPRAGADRGRQVAPAVAEPAQEQPALPRQGSPAASAVPARPEESVPAAQAPSRLPVPAPRPSPGGTVSASAPRTASPSAPVPAPGPSRSGPSAGPVRREPAAVG